MNRVFNGQTVFKLVLQIVVDVMQAALKDLLK